MSDIVDRSFEGEDWEGRAFPTQHFPEEVLKLLGALNASRARGWLSAESHIRDLGAEGRIDLAKFFTLAGESKPLFVWLQQHEQQIDWRKIRERLLPQRWP